MTPVRSGLLQRQCACGGAGGKAEECPECQQKRQQLQRFAVDAAEPAAVPAIVHEVLHSSGEPLAPTTRAFMESRFGHDFSQVRVHTDARAAESAQAVHALAYTVGNHIVFDHGLYAPTTPDGVRLLAHELVHTQQQSRWTARTSAIPGLHIGAAESPQEREAEAMAREVVAAESPTASSRLDGTLPSATVPTAGLSGQTHGRAVPSLSLQRQEPPEEKPRKPLIPIPVFDELDPMILVPDIDGIPEFLRGQEVKLSTLRSALDVLRGDLPKTGPGQDVCSTLLPGYETASSGDVQGFCCPKFVRDKERCCHPRHIGLKSFRCCTAAEVVVNHSCIQPPRITPPIEPPKPRAEQEPPSVPRLELQVPRVRFGSIMSDTIDRFAVDSAAVPAAASTQLDRLARQIKLYHEAEVHIEGHTDSSHTPEYNQTLSERRAQAVRDALVRRGVDATRFIVEGFGEEQLLFSEERTEEEKARNRRVDIWLYIPPSPSLSEQFRLQPPSLLTTP